MKLRQQLLILSLLILSLPWAGCQYVREMESLMIEGQERELMASARAVALGLAETPGLFSGADEKTSEASIYFHNLPSAPDVDAYSDEWRRWPITALAMIPYPVTSSAEPESMASLRAGFSAGMFYLYIDIEDPSPAFVDTLVDPLRSGDYLEIIGADQVIVISVGSQGSVVGRYQNEQGAIVDEYRVSGIWRSNSAGHHIELRVNPSVLNAQLALRYVDRYIDPTAQPFPVSAVPSAVLGELRLGFERAQPSYYATANTAIRADIEPFASSDLRLGVSDRSGWLLASAGELGASALSESLNQTESPNQTETDQSNTTNALVSWLYSLILRSDEYPQIDNWQADGRFKTLDVMSALSGEARTAEFSLGKSSHVVRAVFPVRRGGELLGTVVAEKSSAAVMSATDTAFSRLIFWVLLVTLFVSLGLLLYASLLSLRIRRLSRAAEEAMIDPASGHLADRFPVSGLSDEIGDLSRSYHQLLGRLDEYTLYLQTLSSKLSHELRTPLAVIRSSLDNLEQQRLSSEASVYSQRASEGAARLSAILNAMSSASRLEESIKSSELESINMGELLSSVVAGYRDAYPESGFQLLLPEKPVSLEIAPDLFVQMLDKLVDNARDFCAPGEQITLSLSVQGAAAIISVINPGPLLPEKMKSQLFDSLVSVRQGADSTAHLGLGLHIVRLIAEHQGARVAADNLRDGSGVEFRIEFPLDQ